MCQLVATNLPEDVWTVSVLRDPGYTCQRFSFEIDDIVRLTKIFYYPSSCWSSPKYPINCTLVGFPTSAPLPRGSSKHPTASLAINDSIVMRQADQNALLRSRWDRQLDTLEIRQPSNCNIPETGIAPPSGSPTYPTASSLGPPSALPGGF